MIVSGQSGGPILFRMSFSSEAVLREGHPSRAQKTERLPASLSLLRYTPGMVSLGEIKQLADTIVREYRPERVVLFGSYANGTAREDSDIDLLVVMPFRGKGVHKAVEILGKLRTRAAVDLLVRTPEDIRRRIRLNDFMLRSILEQGKVLHESPRP